MGVERGSSLPSVWPILILIDVCPRRLDNLLTADGTDEPLGQAVGVSLPEFPNKVSHLRWALPEYFRKRPDIAGGSGAKYRKRRHAGSPSLPGVLCCTENYVLHEFQSLLSDTTPTEVVDRKMACLFSGMLRLSQKPRSRGS